MHHYWFNHEKKVTLFGLKLLGFFVVVVDIDDVIYFVVLFCFIIIIF